MAEKLPVLASGFMVMDDLGSLLLVKTTLVVIPAGKMVPLMLPSIGVDSLVVVIASLLQEARVTTNAASKVNILFMVIICYKNIRFAARPQSPILGDFCFRPHCQ